MTDSLIEREEVVALLFNVSDLVVGVKTIVQLLTGDEGGEEEEEDDQN